MTIELLDSPGIIPGKLINVITLYIQLVIYEICSSATRLNNHGAMQLAICNDIGAAAYGKLVRLLFEVIFLMR